MIMFLLTWRMADGSTVAQRAETTERTARKRLRDFMVANGMIGGTLAYGNGHPIIIVTRRCEWFAACDHEATGVMAHPIIGDVPTCDRCSALILRQR